MMALCKVSLSEVLTQNPGFKRNQDTVMLPDAVSYKKRDYIGLWPDPERLMLSI